MRILLLLLSLSCSAFAQLGFRDQTMRAVVPNGLIGYYRLNRADVVPDLSGNGYNGTPTNSPNLTSGIVGNALNFSNNFIYLPTDFGITEATPFTLCAWVNANANAICILQSAPEANPYSGIWFTFSSGGVSGKAISVVQSGFDKYLKTTINASLSADTFYYMCAVYDGSTNQSGLNLYVNGSAPAQTKSHNGTVSGVPKRNFRIATDTDATGHDFFKGKIQEVRIYNRALTTNEINQLYLAGH